MAVELTSLHRSQFTGLCQDVSASVTHDNSKAWIPDTHNEVVIQPLRSHLHCPFKLNAHQQIGLHRIVRDTELPSDACPRDDAHKGRAAHRLRRQAPGARKDSEVVRQARPVVRREVLRALDLPDALGLHLRLSLLLHLLQGRRGHGDAGVLEPLPARLQLLQVHGDEGVAGLLQGRDLGLGGLGPVELLERLLLLLQDALDVFLPLTPLAEEVGEVDGSLHALAEVDALGVVQGLQRLDALAGVVQEPVDAVKG